VSFTLIRLSSKKAMRSAYSLRANTSAWSRRMSTGPHSLPCYYLFPAFAPQKNEDWAIGDHRVCVSLSLFQPLNPWKNFHETSYVPNAIGGCSAAVNL
jgi:hypothetical protein